MRDYYEILGVAKTAEIAEIKKSYRRLAMENHPDRNPGDAEAEARFKEAAAAYEVLSDPTKRQRYDQFGHAGLRSNGGGAGGFTDVNDIFSAFSDIFGGGSGTIFDEVFGGRSRGGSRRRNGRPGSDLRIKLPLTLEEISTGVEKKVRVRKYVACEACEGSGADGGKSARTTCTTCNGAGEVQQVSRSVFGQFVNIQPCPTCAGEGSTIDKKCAVCSGEGRTKGEETIPIAVPPGVLEGHYLTLRGAGNSGQRGGWSGDLRVEIEEVPHDEFSREGLDIYHDLYLSFPDAVIGTEVEVPTLKGTARLQIDPGVQSGKILRMRERGIPDVNGGRRGDQMVRLNVWTPQNLSREELETIEKFRESPSFAPDLKVDNKSRSFFSKVKDVFT